MATVFETEICSRCGGTGQYSFNGEHSRCYKCDGKNGCRAYTKRGAAAKAYYEAKLQVPATEIKVGDKIRQMPYIKQLTVATVKVYMPTGRAWTNGVELPRKEHVRFQNETGLAISVAVDEMVRRLPTVEENEVAIADALAYQETLTKAGKPRHVKKNKEQNYES